MNDSIEVETDALRTAIGQFDPIICGRGTLPIPILSCVRLIARNGILTIDGTDLEKALVVAVKCSDGEFACAVQYRRLASLVENAVSGWLRLAFRSGRLLIGDDHVRRSRAVSSEFMKVFSGLLESNKYYNELPLPERAASHAMTTLEASEMPPVVRVGEDGAKINCLEWIRALKLVLPFAGVDDSRDALNGILVQWNHEHGFTFVATDGKMIAVAGKNCCSGQPWIIPRNSIPPLVKFHEFHGEAVFAHTKDRIAFQSGDDYYTTGLIKAKYPNWQKVFPVTPPLVTVTGADWANALKRVQWAASEVKMDVILRATGAEVRVGAGGKKADLAKAAAGGHIIGEGAYLFNHRLFSSLATLAGPEAEIGFHGPNDPCVLVNGDITAALMPMHE